MTTKPSSQPASPTKATPATKSPKNKPASLHGAAAGMASSVDGASPKSPRSPTSAAAGAAAKNRAPSPARHAEQHQQLHDQQPNNPAAGQVPAGAAYAAYPFAPYAVYEYPAGAAAGAVGGAPTGAAAYQYYGAGGAAHASGVAGGVAMHNGMPQHVGAAHQQQYAGGSPRHGHVGGQPRNRTNVDASGRKTTVWMGLDAWMDETAIKSIWANIFPDEEVQVKLITNKFTGAPANYCFLDFATHESAAAAVARSGTPVPGSDASTFRLNWASGGGHPEGTGAAPRRPYNPQHQHQQHQHQQPQYHHHAEYSVFVGDLSMDVTDEMLSAAFTERFPTTRSAKVITDVTTGASRGFGFVRFTAPEDMHRAIAEMNGVVLGQRGVRVGPAAPKPRAVQGVPQGYHHHHHAGAAQGAAGAQVAYAAGPRAYAGGSHTGAAGAGGYRTQSNAAANAALAAAAAADPTNATVFVGGLSQPVTDDELRAVFSSQGEIVNVKIPQAKGCAFVTYARRESAVQAIAELNGFQVGQNKVRLSWGRPHSPRPHHHQQQHHGAGVAHGAYQQQQAYPQYAYYYANGGAAATEGQQQAQQEQGQAYGAVSGN